jgi:hypothetical protein
MVVDDIDCMELHYLNKCALENCAAFVQSKRHRNLLQQASLESFYFEQGETVYNNLNWGATLETKQSEFRYSCWDALNNLRIFFFLNC